jgi:transposase
VWDSVRLPPETKERLLDMVVEGLPSNSQQFRGVSSAASRERFSRLARACCAYAAGLRKPFTPPVECGEATFVEARHWPRLRGAARRAVVFGIVEHEGTVKATRARRSMELWLDIAPVTTPGAPHYVETQRAYVWLPVQGERVVIPKGRRPRKRTAAFDQIEGPGTPEEPQSTVRPHAGETIERFGSYFEERLKHFRSVPCKDFHLYVGDVCFRFNSRHKDVKRKLLIMKLMKRYSPEQLHGVWP